MNSTSSSTAQARLLWKVNAREVMIRWCALGGIPVAITLLLFIYVDESETLAPWIPCYLAYFLLIFLNLPFIKERTEQSRTGLLVLSLHIMGWTSLYVLGVDTGPVLICFLAILTSGLLLPRWTLVVSLLISSALMSYSRTAIPDLGIPGHLTAAGFASTTIAGVAFILFLVRQLETEVRNHVEALAQITQEQEQRAQTEATLATVRQELEDSRKFEAMGRVAGGVAHEFNNILQRIVGWSEELEFSEHPEQNPEIFDNIRSSTSEATHLTRDLLSIASRGLHKTTPIPLAQFVEAWSEEWREALRPECTLEVEIQDVGTLMINAQAMKNALDNLVQNAAHESVGATHIHIRTEPSGPDTDFVQIMIEDNGKGLSQNEIRMVFDPFYTTKGHGETGLGLSVVRGTMRQFGGSINLLSAPNEGCKFCMRIPKIRGGLSSDRKPAPGHT